MDPLDVFFFAYCVYIIFGIATFFPVILFIPFFINFSNDAFLIIFVFFELSIIIYIIISHRGKFSCYPILAYFIIQTISSIFFLVSFLLRRINLFLLIFSIFVKIGIYPFHFWFINVCSIIKWRDLFYIISFQKFLPVFVFFNFFEMDLLIEIVKVISIFNLFVAWANCYISIDARLFFSYNSIVDQSWLVVIFILDECMAYVYIFIQVLFIRLFFINLDKCVITYISDFSLRDKNSLNLMISMFTFIGVPPRLGFILKVFIIGYFLSKFVFIIFFFLLFVKITNIFFFVRPIMIIFSKESYSLIKMRIESMTKISLLNLLVNLLGVFLLAFFVN